LYCFTDGSMHCWCQWVLINNNKLYLYNPNGHFIFKKKIIVGISPMYAECTVGKNAWWCRPTWQPARIRIERRSIKRSLNYAENLLICATVTVTTFINLLICAGKKEIPLNYLPSVSLEFSDVDISVTNLYDCVCVSMFSGSAGIVQNYSGSRGSPVGLGIHL
jgi:hypothetical protein